MTYASFWKRTAAYLVDGFIYAVASSLIGKIIGLFVGLAAGIYASAGNPSWSIILFFLAITLFVQIVCYILYFVWPESSSWQATIGKKIFGLKVTDGHGQRISFGRSLGRNLGMIISSIILCIGYLMCLWTAKKQCLHDQMADCLVLDTKPGEKQGCVIATVIAFFFIPVVFLVLGIIAAIALPQVFKAHEKARAAQAISLTQDARQFQRLYQQANSQYATRWNQLRDFTPCAAEDSHLCEVGKFTLELEKEGIAAQRNSGNYRYRLFRAYDPADTRRDLVCVSQDATSKTFCQQLMRPGRNFE